MPAPSPAIRHWAAKSGGLTRDRASDDPERVEAETGYDGQAWPSFRHRKVSHTVGRSGRCGGGVS
jgi:hypothetical protein